MLGRHRSHLASTCAAVLQHVADARQVITTGRTPGGGRVTPLPEPVRTEVLARLDAVSVALVELVRTFAPGAEEQAPGNGSLAATRMWLSILLRTADELVRDIHPAQLGRQYGDLEDAEAEALARETDGVRAVLRAALDRLP